jgi:hypothetical protein
MGNHPPHILLRDYARGIIEYGVHRRCLPQAIDLNLARPPYTSDEWPLEIPSKDDVVAETNEDYAIRSSVLDGDFGCYVMGNDSKWSITPLTNNQAEKHLDRVQSFLRRVDKDADPNVAIAFDRFNSLAISLAQENRSTRDQQLLAETLDTTNEVDCLGRTRIDRQDLQERTLEAELQFLNMLSEPEQALFSSEIKPYLEWGLLNHLADRFIHFDINAERRWVLKRARSLGWEKNRFSIFENSLDYTARRQAHIERIGKKYQWIAWHELQARLSDHLYFIESDCGVREAAVYQGPWQLMARNIDPSMLMHRSQYTIGLNFTQRTWWRPAQLEHLDNTTEERIDNLWKEDGFPCLKSLLKVRDPRGNHWLVLGGVSKWHDRDDPQDSRPRRDTWIRITSFLVASSDLPNVLKALNKKESTYLDSHEPGTGYQVFMGEYPWHPANAPNSDDWVEVRFPNQHSPIPVNHIVPIVNYVWESEQDQSIDNRVDFMLPSQFLRDHSSLHWTGGRGVSFRAGGGECVFFDPSLVQAGPSAALVDHDHIVQLLRSLNLCLVWRIVGEKGLYPRSVSGEFYGQQVLLGDFQERCHSLAAFQAA